jgi:hypothetical protein
MRAIWLSRVFPHSYPYGPACIGAAFKANGCRNMKTNIRYRNEEILERFDRLPDDAVIPDPAAAAVLSVSERTLRYRMTLPKIQLSKQRQGRRVGDIRALVRGTMLDAG